MSDDCKLATRHATAHETCVRWEARRLVSNGPLGGVSGGLGRWWVGIALSTDPAEGWWEGACFRQRFCGAVRGLGGSGEPPGGLSLDLS